MRKFPLLFVIALVAVLFTCKKQGTVTPQVSLPSPTQNGTNTIAWTTAGENYVSTAFSDGVLYDDPGTNAGYFVLQSTATGSNYNRYIYLTTQSGTPMPIQVGNTYSMSGGSQLQESIKSIGIPQQFELQVTDGTFTITHYDPANQVISGVFKFSTFPNTISGVPARPTSGWFDIKYRLYTTDPNLFIGAVNNSQPRVAQVNGR